MDSEIWRVRTEKVGSLEPFKSERDMESFLMNNPAIVGCWNPESDIAMPSLIRQQICLQTQKGMGRLDLLGISISENNYELRIFELKAGDIEPTAVDQLDSYIKGWKLEQSSKSAIRDWVLSLNLEGIDEKNIDKIIDHPVGILVGSKFQPEAISIAIQLNIQGIRLARFKAERKSEYFVIVEDQVGKIVETSKRQWSWKDLIDQELMAASDDFSISHEGIEIMAKPDPVYLDYYTKKIILDEESRKRILEKEDEIRKKANEYDKKWLDKSIESLKNNKGIFISNATGLCYLAFGGPTASYWIPTYWWIHQKTGKTVEQLKEEYFDMKI